MGEDAMGSFASKSSLKNRQLPYLAVCILTSTTLACASDDSDTADSEETQTSETKSDAGKDDGKEDAPSAENETAGAEPIGPEASAEAQAARDEAANPGSAAVTRYDGDWKGTTSQDKPVSFKILNRFVAHAEVGYAFAGDGCKSAGDFKFSAMTPTRMGAFMLMNASETAKLTISGKFTADDAAEGEYTVEAVGDAPEGCEPSISGSWTASK
jgi:hypothetical protein